MTNSFSSSSGDLEDAMLILQDRLALIQDRNSNADDALDHTLLAMDCARFAKRLSSDPSKAAVWTRHSYQEYHKAHSTWLKIEAKYPGKAMYGVAHTLVGMARMSYTAGDHRNARRFAKELLEMVSAMPAQETGEAVFYSHHLLGLIALDFGDVDAGRHHFLQSAKSTGSPQLNSFGPNFTLALRMLHLGEVDVVLEFLRKCGRFWKSGSSKICQWETTIQNGSIPFFGANLEY